MTTSLLRHYVELNRLESQARPVVVYFRHFATWWVVRWRNGNAAKQHIMSKATHGGHCGVKNLRKYFFSFPNAPTSACARFCVNWDHPFVYCHWGTQYLDMGEINSSCLVLVLFWYLVRPIFGNYHGFWENVRIPHFRWKFPRAVDFPYETVRGAHFCLIS